MCEHVYVGAYSCVYVSVRLNICLSVVCMLGYVCVYIVCMFVYMHVLMCVRMYVCT